MQLDAIHALITQTELTCGIDEVGRGPIAGPVVACCVIMKPGEKIPGVTDSKKISGKKRERLYDTILSNALAVGYGRIANEEIDQTDIRSATKKAMKIALETLSDVGGRKVIPELVMVDYEHVDTDLPQISLAKGDEQIYVISCASILAKVTRDREMIALGHVYPEYGFENHKGYGTKKHYEAIQKHGLLPIHRRSFIHGEEYFEHVITKSDHQ